MKTFSWLVGIGVSLAFVAPAFGIENPARTDSVSEPTLQHFLLAQAVDQTGTVNFFNATKGFGYITPDDGSVDLFVHHSAIHADTFKVLTKGQKVMYDVDAGNKKSAVNVRGI